MADPFIKEDQDISNQSSNKHALGYNQFRLDADLLQVAAHRDKLLSGNVPPTEKEILEALSYCDVLVDRLIQPTTQAFVADTAKKSSHNALLSLQEKPREGSKTPEDPSPYVRSRIRSAVEQLSQIAYSIVAADAVFVTPQILRLYVEIQAKLGKPESFSVVFHLYANKPIPLEGTSPIKYKKQRPNKVANAIPADIANHALKSAIDVRQLDVALEIVESTYATQAHHRAKLFKKALIPAAALAAAPFGIFQLAKRFADFQTTMDPEMATRIAVAGMFTYVSMTTMVGFIVVATANDQMDRVTWAPGVRLRERWLREEERAAYDKIAGAWGFRETWRRGEEEGEEWERLRECIGQAGMILDRVSLMEDMN